MGSRLGHVESVLLSPWPTFDDAATVKDEVEVVVQVNGKLRSRFSLSTWMTMKKTLEAKAAGR
jgi:leucyl-tRNA synthetase